MKKFSKLLAMSLATALVFGMTVSAAPSPITSDGDIEVIMLDGEAPEGAIKLVADEGAAAAPSKADANKVIASENSDYELTNVTWSGDVHFEDENGNVVPMNEQVVVLFNANGDLPGGVAGKYYVVLHWNGSAWEAASDIQEGPVIYAVFSSLSPVAIVEVDKKADDDDDDDDDDTTTEAAPASAAAATGVAASPKTGETAPVAVLFAVASLGAAVACSRKARYNK